jgi:hypothetical protein
LLDYMKSSFRWFGTSIGLSFSKYIWEIVKGGPLLEARCTRRTKAIKAAISAAEQSQQDSRLNTIVFHGFVNIHNCRNELLQQQNPKASQNLPQTPRLEKGVPVMVGCKNHVDLGALQLSCLQNLLWPYWIDCRTVSSFFVDHSAHKVRSIYEVRLGCLSRLESSALVPFLHAIKI